LTETSSCGAYLYLYATLNYGLHANRCSSSRRNTPFLNGRHSSRSLHFAPRRKCASLPVTCRRQRELTVRQSSGNTSRR
jgi:hypothetical protein